MDVCVPLCASGGKRFNLQKSVLLLRLTLDHQVWWQVALPSESSFHPLINLKMTQII